LHKVTWEEAGPDYLRRRTTGTEPPKNIAGSDIKHGNF